MKANTPSLSLQVDCSYWKMVQQQLTNGTFPKQRSGDWESSTSSLQQQNRKKKKIKTFPISSSESIFQVLIRYLACGHSRKLEYYDLPRWIDSRNILVSMCCEKPCLKILRMITSEFWYETTKTLNFFFPFTTTPIRFESKVQTTRNTDSVSDRIAYCVSVAYQYNIRKNKKGQINR